MKVVGESAGLSQDSTHAYICVAAETELQRAIEAAHSKAKEIGLAIATVDGSPVRVPGWRSLLWTSQGRKLRKARELGVVLTITRYAVDPQIVVGE
jgi:hypothetical protein